MGAVGFQLMLGVLSLLFFSIKLVLNVFIIFKKDLHPVYVIIKLIIKLEINPKSWLICLKRCEQRKPVRFLYLL